MPRRLKEKEEVPDSEELSEAADYIGLLRKKSLAVVLGALMTLYSFFGAIYRIPVALDQHTEKIAAVEGAVKADGGRITDLEKQGVVTTYDLAEALRTKARVDTLEKAMAGSAVMQLQIQRLEEATKELTKAVDLLGNRLVELNGSVTTLKDTNVETRRAIEELKRK